MAPGTVVAGAVTKTGQGSGTTDYTDGGSDGQSSWSVSQTDHVAFNAQLTNTLLAGFVYGDADGWQVTGFTHTTANGSGTGSGSSIRLQLRQRLFLLQLGRLHQPTFSFDDQSPGPRWSADAIKTLSRPSRAAVRARVAERLRRLRRHGQLHLEQLVAVLGRRRRHHRCGNPLVVAYRDLDRRRHRRRGAVRLGDAFFVQSRIGQLRWRQFRQQHRSRLGRRRFVRDHDHGVGRRLQRRRQLRLRRQLEDRLPPDGTSM